MVQTLITMLIISAAVAYLAVRFLPRRKRAQAHGCGGCNGAAGCCSTGPLAQGKLESKP